MNSKNYFYIYLFSNNPSRNRIKLIAEDLGLDFSYYGGKPSKSKLQKFLNTIPHSSKKIAMIGDRIFTDILVGNKLDMYTILVDSVDHFGNRIEGSNIQSIERKIAKIITGVLP